MEEYPADLMMDKKVSNIINKKVIEYLKKMESFMNLPNSFYNDTEDINRTKFKDNVEFNKTVEIVKNKMRNFDDVFNVNKDKMLKLFEEYQNDIDRTFSNEIQKKRIKLQRDKIEELMKTEGFDYEVKEVFLLLSKDDLSELTEDEINDIENKLNTIERYINFKHANEKDLKAISKLYDKISAFFMNEDIKVKEKVEFINNEYQTFLYLASNIDEIDNQYQKCFAELEACQKLFGIDYRKYGDISSLESISEVLDLVHKEMNDEVKERYISNSIKDVMSDFGYNVINNDVVSKEQMLFDYDGESALSLYRSKEGMVMLELVATGDESEMTDNDKTMFLDKMVHFCDKYPKILAALRAKGITINTIKDMPIKKDFVRKVAIKKGIKRNVQTELKKKRFD